MCPQKRNRTRMKPKNTRHILHFCTYTEKCSIIPWSCYHIVKRNGPKNSQTVLGWHVSFNSGVGSTCICFSGLVDIWPIQSWITGIYSETQYMYMYNVTYDWYIVTSPFSWWWHTFTQWLRLQPPLCTCPTKNLVIVHALKAPLSQSVNKTNI